jgi:hypothetical protein
VRLSLPLIAISCTAVRVSARHHRPRHPLFALWLTIGSAIASTHFFLFFLCLVRADAMMISRSSLPELAR